MYLSPYFTERDGFISVSEYQASQFAKTLAGDFNPIHDEDARKFLVPGDLLFALVVNRLGAFQSMNFNFLAPVGADIGLNINAVTPPQFEIQNQNGKAVMSVEMRGENNTQDSFCEGLVREYVAFSGQNFPHILVPLMAEKNVMINPARPLVMYESMSLEFDRIDVADVKLSLADSTLEVDGKRGRALLNFELITGTERIGHGVKKLALGGLLPFEKAAMDAVVEEYEAKKAAFQQR